MRFLPVVLIALVLGACSSQAEAPAPAPAVSKAPIKELPIKVHSIGDPAAIDLLGDGLATVTVSSVATTASGDAVAPIRLVLNVNLLLDRAGRPVSGGPDNFLFRDAKQTMYRAKTSGADVSPVLARTDLTTAGQRTEGKIFFDLPEGAMAGGHVQLMTGAMVIAVWKLPA